MRATEFWSTLSFLQFFSLISIANILMYAMTALIVFILRRYFIQFDLNFQNQEVNQKEYIQSGLVVISNIFIGLVGYILLQIGVIQLAEKGFSPAIFDFVLIFFGIDIGMYFSHIIVHKTPLYRWLHKDHHAHDSMSLVSLYVMHPFEALAFGVILLSLLSIYTFDLTALFVFLFLNWILGVFAHSGIEPSQGKWGNYICMTRFHQIHHETHNSNYGFYTPFLDLLFKTRKYHLKKEPK